jgi:hypothetical protein
MVGAARIVWPEGRTDMTKVIGIFVAANAPTYLLQSGGRRWRSWLRSCATIWKVAGSIPYGHWNYLLA